MKKGRGNAKRENKFSSNGQIDLKYDYSHSNKIKYNITSDFII